jgi:hypothetical protein
VGLSEPLETEEPVKVVRPPGNVQFQIQSPLIREKGLFELDPPFKKKNYLIELLALVGIQ